MKILHHTPIAIRLWLIVILSIIGLSIAVIGNIRQSTQDAYATREAMVRSAVESAHATLTYYAGLAKQGKMSLVEAQEEAKRSLRAIRYSGSEYIFAYDFKGDITIQGANPDREGKNLWTATDANGKNFARIGIEEARDKGEAHVTYVWPKPGLTQPEPKLSYLKAVPEWQWVVGSGMYVDDVEDIVHQRTITALIQSTVIVVLLIAGCLTIARSISAPLKRLTASLRVLADGASDVTITDTDKGAEIGDIVHAVQVFKDKTSAIKRMEQDRAESEARINQERRAMLMNLADGFEASVKHVVGQVGNAATALHSTAVEMNNTVNNSVEQATAAASAAEQASSNVQTMAAATEELTASIEEISVQITRTTGIAGQAVEAAERSNSIITQLSETTVRIGEVIKLINDIASQTNLLALNATIEAARAGDAGKGFAVVAGEVKSLANQTARATEEISGQINAVQQGTRDAVQAIRGVGSVISEINTITTTIAAAVQEQGAATREISRNAQEAAKGTQYVSENVIGLRSSASKNGVSASNVLGQAERLSSDSATLTESVDRFLTEVRAS